MTHDAWHHSCFFHTWGDWDILLGQGILEALVTLWVTALICIDLQYVRTSHLLSNWPALTMTIIKIEIVGHWKDRATKWWKLHWGELTRKQSSIIYNNKGLPDVSRVLIHHNLSFNMSSASTFLSAMIKHSTASGHMRSFLNCSWAVLTIPWGVFWPPFLGCDVESLAVFLKHSMRQHGL